MHTFSFLIRKILNQNAMHNIAFYLVLKNEPWFGPAGSEKTWRVATQLYA